MGRVMAAGQNRYQSTTPEMARIFSKRRGKNQTVSGIFCANPSIFWMKNTLLKNYRNK
jgi:hypothetical protein